MAYQRNTIPSYQHHSSGRARVRTYGTDGKRIDIVLPGVYGSAESKQEYERMLRTAMVAGSWLNDEEVGKRKACNRPIGFARTTCNRHIGRIKSVFKWGVSIELVPQGVYHALATVAGPRRGRSSARETEPVKPRQSRCACL